MESFQTMPKPPLLLHLTKVNQTNTISCTQHVLTLNILHIEKWRTRLDNNYISSAILKNLFKAFDCKLHNLISAKLAIALKLSFPSSKNRKQRVLINNTYSKFEDIILGIPQGSLVGPLLFNLSINDLFSLLSLSQSIISQLILH